MLLVKDLTTIVDRFDSSQLEFKQEQFEMKLEEQAKTPKKFVSIKVELLKNLLSNMKEMTRMLKFKSKDVEKYMEEIKKAQYVASDDLVYETIRAHEDHIRSLTVTNNQLTMRIQELSKEQNRAMKLDDELKGMRKQLESKEEFESQIHKKNREKD